MQKIAYELSAKSSTYGETVSDLVVGSYDEHNDWGDYDTYLMCSIDESFCDKIALDFTCGPGRNIIKYHKKFKRIDGCDISEQNIKNAKSNILSNGISLPELYVTNGNDLGNVKENFYDFIFSTIALQHICVHKIRYSILSSMYKALKKSGRISIQMEFGKNSPDSVGYYENNFNVIGTNRACDTRVEESSYIEKDLKQIGFTNFQYWIRPTGPGDTHPNWIFFTAVK